MKMKKQFIYDEFQRIAKEIVGENRKAQKYYVMQMCEMLGKVDYKRPFVLWCSRKRVLAYQTGMQGYTSPKTSQNGAYYLFRHNAESADKVTF